MRTVVHDLPAIGVRRAADRAAPLAERPWTPAVLGGAAVILAAYGLWCIGAVSGAGFYSIGGMAVIACGVCLALAWLAGFSREFKRAAAGGRLLWLIVPAVAACTAGLIAADVPRHARFAYGRPELERAARAVLADPASAPVYRNRSLGTEWIDNVDTGAGKVVRFYLKGNWVDWTVLIYSPGGKPADPQRRQTGPMVPLGGDWYRYEYMS